MFTESVYIKKPKDRTLELMCELGYVHTESQSKEDNEYRDCLFARQGKMSFETESWCKQTGAIGCTRDEQDKFLSLTALCDHRDTYQWYVLDEEINYMMGPSFVKGNFFWVTDDLEEGLYDLPRLFHKATREEILRHFDKYAAANLDYGFDDWYSNF